MRKTSSTILFLIASLVAGVGIAYLVEKPWVKTPVRTPVQNIPPPAVAPPSLPPPQSPPKTNPPTKPPVFPPPVTQPPPPPPTSVFTPVFSFADLKAGNLGGKIIHCSGPLFTTAHHDSYLAAFPETKTFMVRSDINIADESRKAPEIAVQAITDAFNKYPKEIPLVSILYTDTEGGGQGIGIGKDKEMIEGAFDSYLSLLANMIKSFNRPTFVRIASEFNGEWSGYHKEYFAKSFQYIVDYFKKVGVTNAIYMWNYMPLGGQFPYMDWYPGDAYVDWWSVEFFANHVQPAPKAEQKRFLDDARAHGKPVIIPESGPSTFDINNVATWDAWFVPYFNLINNDGNIKGFCYSNEDFTKTTDGIGWKNVQIPGTPIEPLYRQELKKTQYLHQP